MIRVCCVGNNPINIVITMAGLGSRFRKAGYVIPKYEIMARERTLFSWSIYSLNNFINPFSKFIFVGLKEHNATAFIKGELFQLGISNWQLVEIDAVTDGQATTVICAEGAIENKNTPIIIYNIDTFVEPQYLLLGSIRGDGWIPCFPGKGDAWSFVRLNEEDKVIEVREKVRISDNATIGLYYFSSYNLYRSLYDDYYAIPAHAEKVEKYVAPLYNALIEKGHCAFVDIIPEKGVHALGTPEEVRAFLNVNRTITG